jgi:putative membrane protein insertion efficiency factor
MPAFTMPPLRAVILAGWRRGRLCFWMLLCLSIPGHASAHNPMKGPESGPGKADSARAAHADPSPVQSGLLSSIRFFQEWISPMDGSRCNFSPTCSRYGYEAVRDRGALLGVIMTADRLMRCSYWTEAGRDYIRLPDGRLHDPVAGSRLTPP